MALYALAGGFLNAYNRSEAAKKQAAAEQAKFERELRNKLIQSQLTLSNTERRTQKNNDLFRKTGTLARLAKISSRS